MQTNKIALIVPNKEFSLHALKLFTEWGEKIHIAIASKDDAVIIAQQLCEKGADALICHAIFASTIKPTINIPLVSLRPSDLDILKGLQLVQKFLAQKEDGQEHNNEFIGIIADTIQDEIKTIAEIMGIHTKPLPKLPGEGATAIQAMVQEVLDVVDPSDGQRNGGLDKMPYFPITVGKETLLKSVRQVQELISEGRRNWAQLEQIKNIIEFTGEGIIAINDQRKITYVNHVAEKFLKMNKEQLLGYFAADIFPDINFEDAMQYGQSRVMPFAEGSDKQLACRVVPVIIRKHTVGAVLAIFKSSQPFKEKTGKSPEKSGHKAVYCFEDFITVNENMQEMLEIAKSYASVDSSVLIIGETGTGKEIVAQSIHNHSRRAAGPFVAVNCAALPESLLESELFGYEYGAFTGARKNGKKGLFEQADTGTIFLDEIGEISLAMQARLLRVVQERVIMRVGGDTVIPVDVGIIAATHRNLPELIEKGLFRRDLYHRLNILQLRLLPLAARKEDIPRLVENINDKMSNRLSRQRLKFSAEAINLLQQYEWPGNVRELESVIERMMVMKKDPVVKVEDIKKVLDFDFNHSDNKVRVVPEGTLEEMEKAIISQVLRETGNQDKTAKMLGISTTTVWRKMKELQNEINDYNLQDGKKLN
ncbi:MAG: norR 8 [Firmicutes bacterium]|nr:norR 8 [Bacillota bacterium]